MEKWLGISHRSSFCTGWEQAGFTEYAATRSTTPVEKNHLHFASRLFIFFYVADTQRGKGFPRACWRAVIYRPGAERAWWQLLCAQFFCSDDALSFVHTSSLGCPLLCSSKGLAKSNLNQMRGTMDKHFFLHFTPTTMIPAKNMPPNVFLQADEIVNQVLEAAETGFTESALMMDLQKGWKDRNATAFEKKSPSYYKITFNSLLFILQPSNSGYGSDER